MDPVDVVHGPEILFFQCRRNGHGNLHILFQRNPPGRLDHHRKNLFDFLAPAPGNDPQNLLRRVDPVPFAEAFLVQLRGQSLEERMSHELDIDSFLAVQLHLERKDDEHLVDEPLHFPYAGLVPGPDLRADIIDDLHSVFPNPPGEPKIESGVVDQHQHFGFLELHNLFKRMLHNLDEGNVLDDFHKPHEAEFPHVIDQLHSFPLHLFPAHAEDVHLRIELLQLADHA